MPDEGYQRNAVPVLANSPQAAIAWHFAMWVRLSSLEAQAAQTELFHKKTVYYCVFRKLYPEYTGTKLRYTAHSLRGRFGFDDGNEP